MATVIISHLSLGYVMGKFSLGDRVVYVGWIDSLQKEGVGGTVIAIQRMPNASGVFGAPDFYLRVILDTAEVVEDRASIFVTESDFHSGSYIPF